MMHPYVTGVGGTTFSSPLTTCSFDPAPSGGGCPPVAMCLHFSKSVSLLLHLIAEIANSSLRCLHMGSVMLISYF